MEVPIGSGHRDAWGAARYAARRGSLEDREVEVAATPPGAAGVRAGSGAPAGTAYRRTDAPAAERGNLGGSRPSPIGAWRTRLRLKRRCEGRPSCQLASFWPNDLCAQFPPFWITRSLTSAGRAPCRKSPSRAADGWNTPLISWASSSGERKRRARGAVPACGGRVCRWSPKPTAAASAPSPPRSCSDRPAGCPPLAG